MIEAIQLSLQNGNQFWQWIDAALYAISKQLTINKKDTYAKTKESGDQNTA
jgi:hypothetical protein